MKVKLQWRLAKSEQRTAEDAIWRDSPKQAVPEPKQLEDWNRSSPLFTYRIVEAEERKEEKKSEEKACGIE